MFPFLVIDWQEPPPGLFFCSIPWFLIMNFNAPFVPKECHVLFDMENHLFVLGGSFSRLGRDNRGFFLSRFPLRLVCYLSFSKDFLTVEFFTIYQLFC